MSLVRNIASGLRTLFRKEQVSRELDEELNGFLDMAVEEKMKQGMSRKDALRAVRLERGNVEVAKETIGGEMGIFRGDPALGYTARAKALADVPGVHERNGSDVGAGHRRNHVDFHFSSHCSVEVLTSGESWRIVSFGERIAVLLPGRV